MVAAHSCEDRSLTRKDAERRHTGSGVRWIADQLPALTAVHELGLGFDLILLSGVWQYVAPGDRDRAMRKLLALLRPGGMLALTLRHGVADAERAMHPVSLVEVEQLSRAQGAVTTSTAEMPDEMRRPDVTWTGVTLRLPDDGTGALPLLRHVIFNDQTSATYKLGLLRALCRAADGQAGMAQDQSQTKVLNPLGLVALNWLRLYIPWSRLGCPKRLEPRSRWLGLRWPRVSRVAGRHRAASRTAGGRKV